MSGWCLVMNNRMHVQQRFASVRNTDWVQNSYTHEKVKQQHPVPSHWEFPQGR